MTDFIAQFRKANNERAAEWDKDSNLDLLFFSNELGGECGELQNLVKKAVRAKLGIRGGLVDIPAMVKEVADVMIVCCLIANQLEKDYGCHIDLQAAMAAKFNETSTKYGLQTLISNVTEEFLT